MSRLFYSLEEAAAKLKKSPAELLQMAQAGQLQEFRDKDQIKFKAADIDQLAQTDDDGLDLELGDLGGGSSGFELPLSGSDAGIPALDGAGLDLDLDLGAPSSAPMRTPAPADDDLLGGLGGADSGAGGSAPPPPVDGGNEDLLGGLGLADSGAGGSAPPPPVDGGNEDLLGGLGLADSGPAPAPSMGLADSNPGRAASGARPSIGLADSGAPTSSGIAPDGGLSDSGLNLETVGSGSGLLDMTRDAADESSAGLQLFEEVSADDSAPNAASGLFADVGAGAEGEGETPAAAIGTFGVGQAVVLEEVSGAWSGATVGFMLGAAACLAICLVIAIDTSLGGTPTLTGMIKGDMMIWVGGLAGAVVVFGVAGFFIGKATE
ncbi:MAG: helix-turn-helix domain-containing protein [Planctomycetes bacterium]|nr:helix-turn-helix domain-containing protein [Planctomycetota bacterium]